jgi:hypothetical protein
MVDTKPLLKGFGAAADVIGQIATDKAVNSRRVRSDFQQFDITDGQLIVGADLANPAHPTYIEHKLGRVPNGAIVVLTLGVGASERHCVGVSETRVQMNQPTGLVTVWVF